MLLLSMLFVVLECVHYIIAFQVVCGPRVYPLCYCFPGCLWSYSVSVMLLLSMLFVVLECVHYVIAFRLFVVLECVHYVIAFQVVCCPRVCPLSYCFPGCL